MVSLVRFTENIKMLSIKCRNFGKDAQNLQNLI